ncbi:MAG: HIT family protein [bacterium]|nr:HIT family protein [bacterium]MDZ4284960.1 HIT family protein [Patescibacteria group bacterium]
MDCLFCNIIAKKFPAVFVYEDEKVAVFLDINPTNPGHTLVVPKAHFENIFDVTEETFCDVAAATKRLAPAIRAAVGADGINLMVNNGRAAGQLIPHIHLHIVPRLMADGFRHWKGAPYKNGEIEQVAEKIRAVLA